jgi:hypothetical protein
MLAIDSKHRELLLEAVEELMYKVSLELTKLKGSPLTAERKQLTEKQKRLEEIQHQLLEQL